MWRGGTALTPFRRSGTTSSATPPKSAMTTVTRMGMTVVQRQTEIRFQQTRLSPHTPRAALFPGARSSGSVPMAFRAGLLLLLWDLAVFPLGVTSSCHVTCSTDYVDSLNCSCSEPTFSGLIEASCNDSLEGLVVNGRCEVKPPESWCVMYPEGLSDVAFVGTTCTATAGTRRHQQNASAPAEWLLCNVVKPLPPVDVRVTNSGGSYNVTWDHGGHECLVYVVRIRDSGDLSENPVYSLTVSEKKIVVDQKLLQPRVGYVVDVQANICPSHYLAGPGSEWSSAARWRTGAAPGGLDELVGTWWYVTLSVILVLVLLSLGYFKKTWWRQKLQRILYIPKAEQFFQPLHRAYGGDFKEWVKPAFSEHDYLRTNPRAQATNERQRGAPQWNDGKRRCGEDRAAGPGGPLLQPPQPHSDPRLFSQDGGHANVSIHTVTLSGEEELEEDHAGRAGGVLPQRENRLPNDLDFGPVEPERVSLDSFASNELSEDGYPRVDLDTIDSGFGECAVHDHNSLSSNYVKQWVARGTIGSPGAETL
ncbi:interleukin 21 receptor, tandem duplicate 1 [Spinachia spinachia]